MCDNVITILTFVLFLIFALVRSFLSSEAVALLVLPSLAFARLRRAAGLGLGADEGCSV
jgi:hypothetical protein